MAVARFVRNKVVGLAPGIDLRGDGTHPNNPVRALRGDAIQSGVAPPVGQRPDRNVFTTHTPVAAGFDRFAPALIDRSLRHYAEEQLRLPMRALLTLGRENPDDPNEPFNMAYLAMRGSAAVNGVSRLHGQVSRRMFQSLFPRWPTVEVPVGHVTNGVHTPSWQSAPADALWASRCGTSAGCEP